MLAHSVQIYTLCHHAHAENRNHCKPQQNTAELTNRAVPQENTATQEETRNVKKIKRQLLQSRICLSRRKQEGELKKTTTIYPSDHQLCMNKHEGSIMKNRIFI